MPFVKEGGESGEPQVLLEQTGPNQWHLRKGFLYRDSEGREFPIRAGTKTDLASVKWPLWWLVASYGRHTRAVLLHDELIDPTPDYEPKVSRREADRLLFVSIAESGFGDPQKGKRPSWMRRWFIWAAVAVLGTMWTEARVWSLLLLLHVWVFLELACVLVYETWVGDVVTGNAYSWWPANVWQSVVLVGAAGFLWALHPCVDRRLGLRLFPTAAAAAAIALPPAALAVVAAVVVAFFDFFYNLYAALRDRDLALGRLVPIITPYRYYGRF